jgi:hypothetical protein
MAVGRETSIRKVMPWFFDVHYSLIFRFPDPACFEVPMSLLNWPEGLNTAWGFASSVLSFN